MATLANVTLETRIILKLLAVSLTIIAIFIVIFKGTETVKNTFFPAPPPPPEEKFGKLPKIELFTQSPVSFIYRINTISGKLPSFPDRINVHKVKRNEPTLLALQIIRENLKNLGFTENERKITDVIYRWNNKRGDRIEVNILSNNFKIISNYLNEAPPANLIGKIASRDGAFDFVASFLGSLGENISDINKDKSLITYWRLANGNLVGVENANQAQFVHIDLFQSNIDKDYQIYYPYQKQSPMHFVLKSEDSFPTIVEANFLHQAADVNQSSTYPIVSPQYAYEQLAKGNALIFNSGNSQSIDITEIQLGYYVGNNDQQYFLPIIVFKGKDFVAYVQAIPASSIGN